LPAGGTLAIVSPAGPVDDLPSLAHSVSWLAELGYDVVFGERFNRRWGHAAGSPADRARDLEDAFADPGVDAILCAAGGDAATHLLGEIDYDVVRRNPKPFVGFSDITVLHAALAVEAGMVTFWGPVASQLATSDPLTRTDLVHALSTIEPVGIVDRTAPPAQVITPGIAEGELVGGTTSLLCSLLGTPWEPDTDGKILLLEDVDEQPARVHRFLTHLLNAGKLERLAGICVGEFVRCRPRSSSSLSLDEIFEHVLAPLGKPVIQGLRLGHGARLATVPLGVRARLDAAAGRLEILEPATS
jgi:muramoyltetrapeptide carboxypeptidase